MDIKMKTTLKSLFAMTMLAAVGTSAAFAQSVPLGQNHDDWQRGVLYQAAPNDSPACSTQWVNLQHAYRHCAKQLFNDDIPGVSDCSDFCP
jgi:hypothetical protein